MKSTSTISQLTARLDILSAEVETLQSALAVQFTRTAQLQAQVDSLRSPERRKRSRDAHLTIPLANTNGNGHRQ
jgi:hypothetical protein